MRPRGPNLARRADLEAAIKRCKTADILTLDGLAAVWGTSKSNFTNTLRLIEKMFEMPPYKPGPQGVHIYPARRALKVLLAYETRRDAADADIQKRQAAILGKGQRKREKPEEALIPMSDLAVASRVMAETEERERVQGLYTALEDQARTAGMVFAGLSNFLSTLHISIDPNGKLPPQVREMVKAGAKKENLRIHKLMKDMLSGHAVSQSRRPKKAGSANGRARGASSRRQSE